MEWTGIGLRGAGRSGRQVRSAHRIETRGRGADAWVAVGRHGPARDSYIYRYTAHTQGCEVGDDVVGRSDRVHTHVFNERELGVVGESALVWGGPRSVP